MLYTEVGREMAVKVGAVIATDGQTIVPLPDGPTIRVRDTVSGVTEELPNPAFGKETDRRPTAARALVAARVDVIATVPGSFCSPSHRIAVEGRARFWMVPFGQSWEGLWTETSEPPTRSMVDRLPTGELMKQNWSSLKHYARLGLRRLRSSGK